MFRKMYAVVMSIIVLSLFVYSADKVEAAPTVGFYNNNSPYIYYGGASGSWTYLNQASTANARNGDVQYTATIGSSAQFTFRGKTVTYWYSKGPFRGSFHVYLDGIFVETISAYGPIFARQNARTLRVTNPSFDHTITIVFASGGSLDVDGFGVDEDAFTMNDRGDDSDASVQKIGGFWTTIGGVSGAYNNTITYSKSVGDLVRYTFKGDTISLFHSKGPNYGKAYIYIDGQDVATIDMWNSSYLRSQFWTFNTEDLSNNWQSQPIPVPYASGGQRRDTHVIDIVVSGLKNPSATDQYIDVDRLYVSEDRLDVRRDVNQMNPNWCWVAVGQIAGEYATGALAGPGTDNFNRQCQLIKALKGTTTCSPNVTGTQLDIRNILSLYYGTSSTYSVVGSMAEDSLRFELFFSRPVISIWSWTIAPPTGHMIIIRGYSAVSNTYQVVIPDPTSGNPIVTNRSYSSLVSSTQFGSTYNWNGTIYGIARN